jgi:alpha-galactosidase
VIAAATHKAGSAGLRLWQVTLANGGNSAATQTLLNSFTIVSNTGNHGCRASVLLADVTSGRTDGSFIDTLC